MDSIEKRKCFIITPIGNDSSDIFRKAKGVIESVIKPVLQKHGFDDIKPAYEITESGMIGNQIIDRIVHDDLVVANLTSNNPNVMYELAIRHTSAKPIVHICEKGTVLPFDIKDNRTIFYTDDMLGVQELRSSFENYVININYSQEYLDNPIYNAIKTGILLKKMDDEGHQNEADLLQEILDKLSIVVRKDSNIGSGNSIKKQAVLEINIILNKRNKEDIKNIERFYKQAFSDIKAVYYSVMDGPDQCKIVYQFSNDGIASYQNKCELINKIAKECNVEINSITPAII